MAATVPSLDSLKPPLQYLATVQLLDGGDDPAVLSAATLPGGPAPFPRFHARARVERGRPG